MGDDTECDTITKYGTCVDCTGKWHRKLAVRGAQAMLHTNCVVGFVYHGDHDPWKGGSASHIRLFYLVLKDVTVLQCSKFVI